MRSPRRAAPLLLAVLAALALAGCRAAPGTAAPAPAPVPATAPGAGTGAGSPLDELAGLEASASAVAKEIEGEVAEG